MFENCVPRGRWILAKYIKYVPVHEQRLHLYEVLGVGNGVTDVSPGEVVVVFSPEQVVEVDDYRVFVWRDYVVAKWNDTLGIANPVAPYMLGERVYGSGKPGSAWHSDAFLMNVLSVPPEVTDIATGDTVVVPARYAWLAGPNMQGTYIFHPDHIVGRCP